MTVDAPSISFKRDSKSHSGRGLQQKRFRHTERYSGNVWHARCDSESRASPVTPPSPGNLCHTGSATGCKPASAIMRENTCCRRAMSHRGSRWQPCASTTHSHPPVCSKITAAVAFRIRDRIWPASGSTCRIRSRILLHLQRSSGFPRSRREQESPVEEADSVETARLVDRDASHSSSAGPW